MKCIKIVKTNYDEIIQTLKEITKSFSKVS